MTVHIDIVGWNESKFTVDTCKYPVWVGSIEYLEYGIFGERQLLVGLSRVFVDGTGIAQGRTLIVSQVSLMHSLSFRGESALSCQIVVGVEGGLQQQRRLRRRMLRAPYLFNVILRY